MCRVRSDFNSMNIVETKGKGGLYRTKDPRDIDYSAYLDHLSAAPSSVVWDDKGYRVENDGIILKVEDQGQSLSCVAQAWSKLREILVQYKIKSFKDLSAHDIYSRIYEPEGGAYGYKGGGLVVNHGVAEESIVPSYIAKTPPTEDFMRTINNSPQALQSAAIFKIQAYGNLNDNIDQYADAIKRQHGIVFGVVGSNLGWSSAYPRPPVEGEDFWYHFIVGVGYKLINGKKYIIILNHWSERWGDGGFGYLSEDYFGKGWVFNGMVAIDLPGDLPIKIDMKDLVRQANSDEQYTVTDGELTRIPDVETLQFLADQKIVTGDARVLSNLEFDRYKNNGLVWPSLKITKAIQGIFPDLEDAFKQDGTK